MKKIFLILVYINFVGSLFSQKPVIDSSTYGNWSAVSPYPSISDDGNYVSYTVIKSERNTNQSLLTIQSSQTNWKIEIPNGISINPSGFTGDNRFIVFGKPGDTLAIASLGIDTVEYIPGIIYYTLAKTTWADWLVYRTSEAENALVIRNLKTKKERSFPFVKSYLFSNDGKELLLLEQSETGDSLNLVNLLKEDYKTVWTGDTKTVKLGYFVFDDPGEQLAFIAEDKTKAQLSQSIWYYKPSLNKAVMIACNSSEGIDSTMQINKILGFKKDGKGLFFTIKDKPSNTQKPSGINVDVWNYKDVKLQSEQLKDINGYHRDFIAMIQIEGKKIIRVEQNGDEYALKFSLANNQSNDFIIVEKPNYGHPVNYPEKIYLMSVNTGDRKLLSGQYALNLSWAEKYIVYYDPITKNYFSYGVSSGVIQNITAGIPVKWTEYAGPATYIRDYKPVGIAGWLPGDSAVLLYDEFDIWQIDPSGGKKPKNLTNGYGRRNDMQFRLADNYYPWEEILSKKKLLLIAFSNKNKKNGFFYKSYDKTGDPELLTMDPCVYDCSWIPYSGSFTRPVKAGQADMWIVSRMSANQSPNYFSTRDFKSFRPLSFIYPERAYNWLTTELVTWKTIDGGLSQGILYKPENFDPAKKYPVIFYYYMRLSDNLNVYIKPEEAIGPINIPYFVSNGYLVFTPDIVYKKNRITGESAVNSVISAANYLSKKPWVDKRRMGINGHSFGGYETNYLITHTGLFAAACTGSGVSDCISRYLSLRPDQGFQNHDFEYGYYDSPTKELNLFIKSSPVLLADRVTTPVLLFHNKNDGAVNFQQGLELFLEMRELKKRVWMLQYDDGDHLVDGKSAADFSIRIAQFFDHFLKDAPPPKWMTEGIPASLKGIETGLELDYKNPNGD